MLFRSPKPLCLAGAIVGGLLLLLFGADLAIGIPFGRADITIDVAMVICSLVLGYMSWSTFREQR